MGDTLSDLLSAIEHIKSLKYNGEAIRREAERMRGDADTIRHQQEEVHMLRGEVTAMWQHLQRMDPNNHHVFGNVSNQLAHEQTKAANPPASMLPPLQQATNPWVQSSSGAMQGVEYPTGQLYDRR